MAGFIYLTFFLVQFNIHPERNASKYFLFLLRYSSINNTQHSADLHLIHSNSRHTHLKLNKRFHPENLFTLPYAPDMLIEISYKTRTPLVHADDPLTNYSFNSPSLRGPPETV